MNQLNIVVHVPRPRMCSYQVAKPTIHNKYIGTNPVLDDASPIFFLPSYTCPKRFRLREFGNGYYGNVFFHCSDRLLKF